MQATAIQRVMVIIGCTLWAVSPLLAQSTVTVRTSDGVAVEGGGSGRCRIQRTGDTSGAIDVGFRVYGSATNGADLTSLVAPAAMGSSVTAEDLFVDPVDDVVLEGPETLFVELLPGAGYVLGSPSRCMVTVYDDELPQPPVFNELLVDPLGPDGDLEFVELQAQPDLVASDLYFVSVEGDGSSPTGRFDLVVDLDGVAFGSNGLLFIGPDSSTWTFSGLTETVLVPGFSLENGTNTWLLIESPTNLIASGTDYDANDDGVLELPAGAVVLDSVGWEDPTSSGFVYSTARLELAGGSEPGMATRFGDVFDKERERAWYSGRPTGADPTIYEATPRSASFPAEGELTPGEINLGWTFSLFADGFESGNTVAW